MSELNCKYTRFKPVPVNLTTLKSIRLHTFRSTASRLLSPKPFSTHHPNNAILRTRASRAPAPVQS